MYQRLQQGIFTSAFFKKLVLLGFNKNEVERK